MSCRQSYNCDLCYNSIEPNAEVGTSLYGVGVYHEARGVKLVNPREAEHHLCRNCMAALKEVLP